MKTISIIILLISWIYLILSIYIQIEFFLEFIPVILLILIINFYIIHQHHRKILLYIFNGIVFLILIYLLSILIFLRQDW